MTVRWNLSHTGAWAPFLIGCALVLALGGSLFLWLQRQADQHRFTNVELAELGAAVSRLDALEWRAVATERVEGEVREALAESGANAYVSKPFVGFQSVLDPLRRLLAA